MKRFIVTMLVPGTFFYIKLKSRKIYARGRTCTFLLRLVTEDVRKSKWDFDEHRGVAHRRVALTRRSLKEESVSRVTS